MPRAKRRARGPAADSPQKAHQFGRTAADDVGDDHAVDAAGRRGGRGVQIGIAIEPDKIECL